MLIINKKRMSFILIILMISVISFAINSKNENTISTVSLPASGKTIVLDAGHGYPDEGDLLLHKENKQLTFYK